MRAGRVAVFAIVLTALLALPGPSPAAADPSPAQLRRLTKQAAQLNDRYRGSIQSLEDIRIQAKRAVDTSGSLQRRLAAAESELASLAETAYILGPLDTTRLFSSQVDPHKALGQAANMSYMVKERASRVAGVEKLIEDAQKARLRANDRVKKLEKEIKNLQSRRRELDRLLAKYGFQQPGNAGGLTQRMISVRAEVMQNFPMPYGVGCLRPGDPGEHGKGRACDFMISRGMATGGESDRGDALAEWLIRNGDRLGVMYIIWKQRYYDIRSGGGWDMMSDRGGVTANHYDHVHVSVF
ncbi:coiled-coil domain-containing protein [Nonomuraea sp. CA-218870]|uniref:coiled-coil domain-containing protein n=1 Tax=Nonomuraea sp. CA-218870 TaxID=3239998 RepID=UPI003D902465